TSPPERTKDTMTKKKSSTAIAKTETASLGGAADAGDDELADILGDLELGTDGLEELDNSDFQISVKAFNTKGKKHPDTGKMVPRDMFFDTVTEEVTDEIDAVLLTLHKTNEYRSYDEAADKSTTHCQSSDQVTGIMADGTTRKCQGCPDAEWAPDPNKPGKRRRNCTQVYQLIGLERLTRKPFLLRTKRTSAGPTKTYFSKHFIGKRLKGGKRSNYPLFAFVTKIGIKMDDSGRYAVPTFERGPVLNRESVLEAAKEVAFFRDVLKEQRLVAAEDVSDDDIPEASPTKASDYSDAEDAELVDVASQGSLEMPAPAPREL
ncbi:MAG: hypothetical protein AAGE52_38620, partial [Myxococcota bacterium]